MIEALIDRWLLPDAAIRAGIRRIVASRLREQEEGGIDAQSERFAALVEWGRGAPVADAPERANAQHYGAA